MLLKIKMIWAIALIFLLSGCTQQFAAKKNLDKNFAVAWTPFSPKGGEWTGSSVHAEQHSVSAVWPFSPEEKAEWAAGPAHTGTISNCGTEGQSACVYNARDFYRVTSAPLEKRWGDKKYEGEVVAMIAGFLEKKRSCFFSLVSLDGNVRITYYHMNDLDDLPIGRKRFYSRGRVIGTYTTDKKQALCFRGYSNAPHVHIAFYEKRSTKGEEIEWAPIPLVRANFGFALPEHQRGNPARIRGEAIGSSH